MVELPDEWNFLNQLPEEWEAPTELRMTPRSSTINLVVTIVSSDLVGNDILEAAGNMLSSYAAFNAWLAVEGGGVLGFEGVSKAGVESSFITRDVYQAWAAFREIFEPVRRVGVGEDERTGLLFALRNGTARLDRLRSGNVP